MSQTPPRPEQTATAPQGFRDALAELVQIGLTVARLVGRVAEAELALADAAAQASAAEGSLPLATSLAEAIEADRAAIAAADARQTSAARAQAVGATFSRVSRSVRLTVFQVERLDRGWARGGVSDDRQAMARRQIARGVAEANARQAEGERAAQLTRALRERLESPDTESYFTHRSPEEIIAIICRDLGLDAVRMTVRPPLPRAISVPAMEGADPLPGGGGWKLHPPQRRPDG
jgi:hypothetical protein